MIYNNAKGIVFIHTNVTLSSSLPQLIFRAKVYDVSVLGAKIDELIGFGPAAQSCLLEELFAAFPWCSWCRWFASRALGIKKLESLPAIL